MKRILLDEVDSTNGYIEQNIKNFSDNVMVIAKNQTNGRGQFHKIWFSESTKSLTLSFLFWNNQHKSKDAIRKTPYEIANIVNQLYNVESEVVLPNDIYLNGRKLCGILIEAFYSLKKLQYVIVGIGVNLNNDRFPDDVVDIATSIKVETNQLADADEFIDILEKRMEVLYV